jgi:hypothetical protein
MLVLVPSYDLPSMLALRQAGATGCLAYDEPVGELGCALINVSWCRRLGSPHTLAALARDEPMHEYRWVSSFLRASDVRRLLVRGLTIKISLKNWF